MKVTMIDYGGSNLRSVQKALAAVGAEVHVADDPNGLLAAERLILPGVGAFGAGMAALRQRGLDAAISAAVREGAHLLGICLGMQLLFEESEEMGRHQGLGLLAGRAVRFPPGPLKVPHIGWNEIQHHGAHPLLAGVPSGSHAYFVHSYYCAPSLPADVIAQTEYGLSFASVIGHGSVFGIQFHPEKSQKTGLRILANYLQMERGV